MAVERAEQLTIRLTADERSGLESLAREQERSLAFVVRLAVREALERGTARNASAA